MVSGFSAQAQTKTNERLNDASGVFTEIMNTPDKGIPEDLLKRAHCAVIVPGMKKGAFVVGASYGKGFALCRSAHGQGWSNPAAVRLEGGSFGLQIGGQETDVVLLVMNPNGMKKLMSSKFTIGADASAAAGPVGRDVQAKTDAWMTAEILTWSRARGVFAGVSLAGSTLRPDEDDNKDLYGRKMTTREVLMTKQPTPPQAKPLLAKLNQYPHVTGATEADRVVR
jgi:lipid-binding SYLF domain-containing protein